MLHNVLISIHTPAKGVTQGKQRSVASLRISIHTPAKGVTHSFHPYACKATISIHTPAKGVTDVQQRKSSCQEDDFNPHSREGSDYSRPPVCDTVTNFNPHSREGSDFEKRVEEMKREISIHTPAKGVTYPRIDLG